MLPVPCSLPQHPGRRHPAFSLSPSPPQIQQPGRVRSDAREQTKGKRNEMRGNEDGKEGQAATRRNDGIHELTWERETRNEKRESRIRAARGVWAVASTRFGLLVVMHFLSEGSGWSEGWIVCSKHPSLGSLSPSLAILLLFRRHYYYYYCHHHYHHQYHNRRDGGRFDQAETSSKPPSSPPSRLGRWTTTLACSCCLTLPCPDTERTKCHGDGQLR
jgi:hypothetical protein